MLITSRRKLNGEYELHTESGKEVGRAWKIPKRSHAWGLALRGVYWRREAFNTRGGSTATECRTLGQARDKASTVPDWLAALEAGDIPAG